MGIENVLIDYNCTRIVLNHSIDNKNFIFRQLKKNTQIMLNDSNKH